MSSRFHCVFRGTPLFLSLFALLVTCPSGQTVQLIWSRVAPGSTGTSATDTTINPYVLAMPAAGASVNGAAAVICPGGGYEHLSPIREGINVGKWLNTLGVSAFVLRYRLGTTVAPNYGIYHHPDQMWDAQRALRWVRANAGRYGINVNKVGIIGFSAGGHLASTAATHFDAGNPTGTSIDNYTGAHDSVDNFSCRPDFQILGYPVITMDPTFTHAGSRNALLGSSNPPADQVLLLSNEKQVTANTPPAFMMHMPGDATVPVKNSQAYADSLSKRGVTRKLWIFSTGSTHGFGMADGLDGAPYIAEASKWPDTAAAWLRSLGFLTATTGVIGPRYGRNVLLTPEAGLRPATWTILGRNLPSAQGHVPFIMTVAAPLERSSKQP